MQALKWTGYVIAAILVLCIGTGIVTLVVTAVLVIGALLSVAAVVGLTARLIKGLVET